MNELQELLGEALYAKVAERLDGVSLLVDDGKLIPKHRFDCVNVSRKEHKEKALSLEAENRRLCDRIAALEQAAEEARHVLRENAVLKAVSKARCRNPEALKALLDPNAPLETLAASLAKQIKRLKKTDPYLFEDTVTYRLVPCYGPAQKEDT